MFRLKQLKDIFLREYLNKKVWDLPFQGKSTPESRFQPANLLISLSINFRASLQTIF